MDKKGRQSAIGLGSGSAAILILLLWRFEKLFPQFRIVLNWIILSTWLIALVLSVLAARKSSKWWYLLTSVLLAAFVVVAAIAINGAYPP
jgi:hypothetical protein